MKTFHSLGWLVLGSLASSTITVPAQQRAPSVIAIQSVVKEGKPTGPLAEVVAVMEDVHSISDLQTGEFTISTGDVIETFDDMKVVLISSARITSCSDHAISVKYPSGLLRQFNISPKTAVCSENGSKIRLSSLASNDLVVVRWIAARTGTQEAIAKGIDALSIRKGGLKNRWATADGRVLTDGSMSKPVDCSCPEGLQQDESALKRSEAECKQNLRLLHEAKRKWAADSGKKEGDTPFATHIFEYGNMSGFPKCPNGGEYNFNLVGERPSCSVHGNSY